MRRLLVLLLPALVLVPAAPAAAVWVPAARVAGPRHIFRVGDATLGPDGTGAVTYVARVGSRKHHNRDRAGFAVRVRGGHWERPALLARGGVEDIRAAAGSDGRLAVAWIAGGDVWGMVSDGGALAAAVKLGGGHASGLDVRMNDEGVGYAVWSQDGAGGRDVRAAQVARTTWTPLGTPLDADANQSAGDGAGRPRVAVLQDGDAVAAWGETDANGSMHVFARRLSDTDAPAAPIEAGVATLGSEPGGAADSPEVDAESGPDAAWIAFRQDVGGRSRSLARRLTGKAIGGAVVIDGGAASRNPVVAVGGETGGLAATGTSDGTVLAAQLLAGNTFAGPTRVDPAAAASAPAPVAAWGQFRGEGAVAYRAPGPGGDAAVFGRLADQGRDFGDQTQLSKAGAGPVVAGSLRIASAPTGDAIVAMLQGEHSDRRRLTVALADREPDPADVAGGWFAGPHPRLHWRPGLDVFGPQRFRVVLDGKRIGTTRAGSLRPKSTVADGRHRIRVIAVDRRGQTTRSPRQTVRVDSTHPTLSVSASRSGRVLKLRVRRSDTGSGVDSIEVRWGDGKRSIARRGPFRHRYAGAGARHVRVTVRDRAGNRTEQRLTA